MLNIVPFRAEHLGVIKLQNMQAHLSEWVTLEEGRGLESHPSYTALLDGKPIGAAGLVHMWEGRAQAWAFLTNIGPKHFLKAHNSVKQFLDACYVKRVEMTCDTEFPAAHRWARALGFHMEIECMKHYSPDGRNSSLYVRIR